MTVFYQPRVPLYSPPLTHLLTVTMLVAGTLGGLFPGQVPVPRNGFGLGLLLYISKGSSDGFEPILTIAMCEVAFFFVILRFVLTMLRSTIAIGLAAAVICAATSFKNWALLVMPEAPARGASRTDLDDVLLLSWALEFVGWAIIFTLTVAVVRRLRGDHPENAGAA